MKPILIDCDDVCIDLLGVWLNRLNSRYNLSYSPEDITMWDISKCIPQLTSEQIFEVLGEEDFYKTIEAIPEAYEYLKKLKDNNYPFKIVTAHDYRSIKYKMDRFFELFPFITWNDIIVTKDKSLIDGFIMIDDNYDNLTSNKLIYGRILFKRFHNEEYHKECDIDMVSSRWEDIYNYIIDDKKYLSNTAKEIINSNKGYRNNSLYDSGVTCLRDIMEFEINELENEDILDTVSLLYPQAFLQPDKYLNIDNILAFVQEKLDADSDDLKGIWLTSKDGVKRNYLNHNEETEISYVDLTNKDYIILSDMDDMGILIAYKGDVLKCIQK